MRMLSRSQTVLPSKSVLYSHIFAVLLVHLSRAIGLQSLLGFASIFAAPAHSEQLLSKVACLIDDVYRSRIDGTACDPELARLTARLDTPTSEKLVASLATAIDSSYSTGVTGAKLALTPRLNYPRHVISSLARFTNPRGTYCLISRGRDRRPRHFLLQLPYPRQRASKGFFLSWRYVFSYRAIHSHHPRLHEYSPL